MDTFIFLHGTYRNLLAVDNIKPVSEEHGGEHVEMRYPSGDVVHVRGYDARALLAKLRDEPSDEVEVREKLGAGYTIGGISEEGAEFAERRAGASANYPRDAVTQAAELAKTLGGSQGRTFDFQDSQGQNREGTVYKRGEDWIAHPANEPGKWIAATSEARAMQRLMEVG